MAKGRLSGKLAVILHADVAGSTALVKQDEQIAHERIQNTFRRFGEGGGGLPDRGFLNKTPINDRSGHLVRIRDSDSNGGFRIAVVQLTSRNFSERPEAVSQKLFPCFCFGT